MYGGESKRKRDGAKTRETGKNCFATLDVCEKLKKFESLSRRLNYNLEKQ